MPYLCMKPALNNKEFFLDLITIFKLIKLEFPFWLLAEYFLETCNSQMADNKGAKAYVLCQYFDICQGWKQLIC
jgi:hypothetical protein